MSAPPRAEVNDRPAAFTPERDPEPPARVSPQVPPPPRPQEALATIARLEDARSDGAGRLELLAKDSDAAVRERAVIALGRLPVGEHGDPVTTALTAALDDGSAAVRAAAAFGLGLRGDPAATEAILAHWQDPEPLVRLRLVEAAGRIEEPRLHLRVLATLDSPIPALRQAAAVAPHRWSEDENVDRVLAEVAARLSKGDPRATRLGLPEESLEDPEVLWRVLFSLSRRRSESGRDAFHIHRQDDDPRARIFSVRGLARIERHNAGRAALEASLRDPDWRVAVEAARGLGVYGDHRSLGALEQALGHDSSHVRRACVLALGNFDVGRARLARMFERVREDPSPSVRAAGLVSAARVLGAAARGPIEAALGGVDTVVRAGAAEAAGALPEELAVELLLSASYDGEPRVSEIAIEALGSHATEAVHARLIELLGAEDGGVRLAAAAALAEQAQVEDLPALKRAFETASGPLAVDLRVELLHTLATLGSAPARDLLRSALRDRQPWVRKAAREGLGLTKTPADGPTGSAGPPAELPLPGVDYDPRAHPRVRMRTTRGELVFELFPDVAPVHVFNFLELARRGHYGGLTFHRVVGDFVVQGGCSRGDGNAAGTWRGADDHLRAEFSPRPYLRGALGMPRSAEPGSGGSQFFVTQRPTPHLDAHYTLFGQLVEGWQVLDAIEVGDRIQSVEPLPSDG